MVVGEGAGWRSLPILAQVLVQVLAEGGHVLSSDRQQCGRFGMRTVLVPHPDLGEGPFLLIHRGRLQRLTPDLKEERRQGRVPADGETDARLLELVSAHGEGPPSDRFLQIERELRQLRSSLREGAYPP